MSSARTIFLMVSGYQAPPFTVGRRRGSSLRGPRRCRCRSGSSPPGIRRRRPCWPPATTARGTASPVQQPLDAARGRQLALLAEPLQVPRRTFVAGRLLALAQLRGEGLVVARSGDGTPRRRSPPRSGCASWGGGLLAGRRTPAAPRGQTCRRPRRTPGHHALVRATMSICIFMLSSDRSLSPPLTACPARRHGHATPACSRGLLGDAGPAAAVGA